jgi:hypothetical protein
MKNVNEGGIFVGEGDFQEELSKGMYERIAFLALYLLHFLSSWISFNFRNLRRVSFSAGCSLHHELRREVFFTMEDVQQL